jgi:uncharacterized membrane protein (UPF0127 family)
MRWLILFLCSLVYAEQIQLGDQVLTVEVATSYEERTTGLMWRKALPEGTGMLFVYEKPHVLAFWMKNTPVALSIAFFNEDRELLNIADMDPPKKGKPLEKYFSDGPALYALEVPQGWFTKHGIGPGDKFSFLDPANEIE